MEDTLIQRYSTLIVKAMIAEANSLKDLMHKLTKGELRELFVSNILDAFLTRQFSISSEIIVNQKGEQSAQMEYYPHL
jgi:hypothetical protein